MILRWAFHQGKFRSLAFPCLFHSQTCLQVMICSSLCSIRTSTKSETWEDCPLRTKRAINLCHWSNILTTSSTDFITGGMPFVYAFTLPLVCLLFSIKDATTTIAYTRISRNMHGDLGCASGSQQSPAEHHTGTSGAS